MSRLTHYSLRMAEVAVVPALLKLYGRKTF